MINDDDDINDNNYDNDDNYDDDDNNYKNNNHQPEKEKLPSCGFCRPGKSPSKIERK